MRVSLADRPRHAISAGRVEEVFTKGEAAVYAALWHAAQGHGQADPFRDVRIGYGRLARLAGMAISNCRVNLEGLARKLAVQAWPAASPGGACGYRVFGSALLHERLSRAGYTHYFKVGPGVRLWKPGMDDSGLPDSTMPDSTMSGLRGSR